MAKRVVQKPSVAGAGLSAAFGIGAYAAQVANVIDADQARWVLGGSLLAGAIFVVLIVRNWLRQGDAVPDAAGTTQTATGNLNVGGTQFNAPVAGSGHTFNYNIGTPAKPDKVVAMTILAMGDGTTAAFYTTSPYKPGSLSAMLDGLWQPAVEDDPAHGAFSFHAIPIKGMQIMASWTVDPDADPLDKVGPGGGAPARPGSTGGRPLDPKPRAVKVERPAPVEALSPGMPAEISVHDLEPVIRDGFLKKINRPWFASSFRDDVWDTIKPEYCEASGAALESGDRLLRELYALPMRPVDGQQAESDQAVRSWIRNDFNGVIDTFWGTQHQLGLTNTIMQDAANSEDTAALPQWRKKLVGKMAPRVEWLRSQRRDCEP